MDFSKSSDSDDEEIIFTNNMLKRLSTNRDKHKLDLDGDAKKKERYYEELQRKNDEAELTPRTKAKILAEIRGYTSDGSSRVDSTELDLDSKDPKNVKHFFSKRMSEFNTMLRAFEVKKEEAVWREQYEKAQTLEQAIKNLREREAGLKELLVERADALDRNDYAAAQKRRDPCLAPPPVDTNLSLITRSSSSSLLITYQIRPTFCQSEVMYSYVVLALLPLLTVALTPNEKLKKCCETLKESDKECVEKFCDLSAISQANILNYLSTCSDRGPTVGEMWDCASLRHDHTECCKAKGVEGKCLEYCSAHDGVPSNYLDYLFCVESFNEIRECFVEHLEKNPFYNKYTHGKGKGKGKGNRNWRKLQNKRKAQQKRKAAAAAAAKKKKGEENQEQPKKDA
ncbi:hypothetical protein WR25_05876 [Diploscapter pachys]|uniref:Domain of unknown function DB domain-containing protein n=1 Tax=Diploscapter pachys TaxID=2018661 RepID=A0A2A2L8R8_9BILA|nr:hypothetical protein WR25_05876 [Diploscapter pachys]